MNKCFVVGDLHGYLQPLKELLNKVKFNNNDKLILLGDLCDRGPFTWELIEFLMTIKNLVFITGNHDIYFKKYLSGDTDFLNWNFDMGKRTIYSYDKNEWKNLNKHKEFLNTSIPYYIENNICFVHGGFDRNDHIENQTEEYLSHDRELVRDMMNSNDKLHTLNNFDKIFIGHTPTIYWNIDKPIIKNGTHLIDTGCGKGGLLTIYDVYDDKYYQSKNKYHRT